ncbi:alanine racemase [Candidatus Microgenomates bacterium]|nr:alanine racemase [Candidatus Microgenomates bacterium]
MDRLTWAEINLRNYSYNFNSIKKIIGSKVKIIAVVKANAYGHGAVEIAKQATELGASYLGVVCMYEAKQLRAAKIKTPILILNYTDPASVSEALDLNLTLNVMDKEVISALDKNAGRKNKTAKIHVKVDTGMHRAGLMLDEALRFIPTIENYRNIRLEGIFTHLATSDERDLSFTYAQLARFDELLAKLKEKKIVPSLIHAANSAASLRVKKAYYNMVRPGVILYGLAPSQDFKMPFTPKPVMSIKSIVIQTRIIEKGETVGYGRTFKAEIKTAVAVIPMGYADGLRRGPVNWGFVLVKGRKIPILGRVSMDQTSIDITNIPHVKTGEEVVLLGKQLNNEITAEDIASKIGTINYEVVAGIASRVSRIYIR